MKAQAANLKGAGCRGWGVLRSFNGGTRLLGARSLTLFLAIEDGMAEGLVVGGQRPIGLSDTHANQCN